LKKWLLPASTSKAHKLAEMATEEAETTTEEAE
jgi:hypothetical protein